MNDSSIESLLRRPPCPPPPAGLKARLLADIRLPEVGTLGVSSPAISPAAPWWRRWFPALAYGALLLGCFIVVAWQTNEWLNLRRENQSLRAAQPDLAELRANHESLQARVAKAKGAGVDAREQAEFLKLRDEVAQLTAREREAAVHRQENARLRAAVAAAQAGQEPEEDPFAAAQERAKRINCVNNLKRIGLALHMWANDNKAIFPKTFQSASNEMNTPKILTCISDTVRKRANTWEELTVSNVSYDFLNPGGDETDLGVVLTRCPIHNNVGLSDGSVQQLGPQHRVELINGKWRIIGGAKP